MRFVYFPYLFKENEKISIIGDQAHHLLNVVRITKDEPIVLLDGKGTIAISNIVSMPKRTIELLVAKVEKKLRPITFSIAIPICRKENVESMIKSAVEIGAHSIIFLSCDHSSSRPIDPDRIDRLVVSALEQSGNSYYPEILPTMGLIEFTEAGLFEHYFVPSSQVSNQDGPLHFGSELGHSYVLLIGPEGGFSSREHDSLLKNPKVHIWKSSTPILRSVTALPFFAGQMILKIACAAKL